jgi:hypothetical protein
MARVRSAAAYWRARALEHLDRIEKFRLDETTEDYHNGEAAFCLANAERLERMGDGSR